MVVTDQESADPPIPVYELRPLLRLLGAFGLFVAAVTVAGRVEWTGG